MDGADAWGRDQAPDRVGCPERRSLRASTWLSTGITSSSALPDTKGGGTERGQVYAYAKDEGGADGWGEAQRLRASDGRNEDHFGVSIAISGSYVVAGATGYDGAGTERGAAYVFKEI